VLSGSQVRDFHVDGFLAIEEPLIDDREIDRLREIYDEMFAQRAGRADGNQFDLAGTDDPAAPAVLPQILHPDRYYPALKGAYLDLIGSIARQLLGPAVVAEIFHAILKPAGIGAPTPWHQDEAYWEPERQYQSMSIWMPLQEAKVENGCLWFTKGTHEWDVLPHQSIGSNKKVHGLELIDASVVRDPVPCPLPAGGITIHRNRTVHFAGPNRTGVARRALVFSASLPDRPRVGERRFPWNEEKQTLRAQRAQKGGESTWQLSPASKREH
jgi:hypothetical protein